MSVTAVPLRPLKKGSVLKLWLGLGALAAAGVGVAYAQTAQYTDSVVVKTERAGHGPAGAEGDLVLVTYVGKLADGKVFDQSPNPVPMPVADGYLIPGFVQALKQVQAGGRYTVHIPARLGYGDKEMGGGVIPANSDLDFELEVTEIVKGGMAAMGQMGGGGGGR
jgi:FKBP-type peptidyl-prolyl cis-trans isomerase FkpA